ncbi:MAG: HDOD domain-containing protein [Steroidobacterales bacterium]
MDVRGVMTIGSVFAVLLLVWGWIILRRRAARRAPKGRAPIGAAGAPPASVEGGADTAQPATDSSGTLRVQAANALVTERLWRLAFGAASGRDVPPEHARLRETVLQVLLAEKLDPKYFPRRPTLMPQLLRAVKDPNVGSGALGSIIAQDPVLAGDTLRLANSSYYRTTSKPIETIQRAVVICGTDGLQSLIATALMQPVFRATDTNFPRFPALLWERTARASRAAELYASKARREDRFEAQLVTLLNALGPLVVYRATLDTYARSSDLSPSAELCVALIGSLGQTMSQRIARQWQSSARLVAALDPATEHVGSATDRSLTHALYFGELLGTLSLLLTENALNSQEAMQFALDAGLPEELVVSTWERLHAGT